MITDLGSFTIGVAVPAAPILGNLAAANVSGQLTALATFTPSVTIPFVDLLALAQSIVANIQAAIAAVPPIPVLSLSAQVALAASISASLSAQLTIINNLMGLLATAGVRILVFDGANNVFGSELATALGGATTHTNAIVLLTTSGATWTAMEQIFKTS